MPCVMCKDTATFNKTVFRGTTAMKVKLCNTCADKVRAEERVRAIKEAVGHDAKMTAVDDFLQSVGL